MKKSLKILNTYLLVLILVFSFSTVNTAFAKQYTSFPKKETSDIYKKWTINFNSILDPFTINNENITVTDSKGNIVKTDTALGKNLKSITVSVLGNGYIINEEYTLIIGTRVKTENGISLSKPLKMAFKVTSTASNNIQNNTNNSYKIYNVAKGDTLWRISKNFNTTVQAIKEINNLDTDSITTGQSLKIPTIGNNTTDIIKDKNNPISDKKDNEEKREFNNKPFKLGNERLLTDYNHLIDGKKIGLVTNQTGVNSKGQSTIQILANYKKAKLTALYGPEHGIDGKAKAGDHVQSYTHPKLKIPVYSLYGDTRKPTKEMLENIDILIFDIQDIGARSYTYMSTLNYCMKAASESNKEIIVLDRPNPLGGIIAEGPVMEDRFITFVGVDNLPMTHGMTAGELANFFNRKIGVKLNVIPMTGYKRDMVYQDTGLKWVQSSPYIPDITSVFCYSAAGLGENTSIYQDDSFKWVGSKGLDSDEFAKLLNNTKLPGVEFIPETHGPAGGVRLKITDYHTFNPAKTGIYVLAYGRILKHYKVPKSGDKIVMFDKIMGTALIGECLEKELLPKKIESLYKKSLDNFKAERLPYLIYN